MVEFSIGREVLTNLFKFGCVTKTKGRGLIDTLEITVENGYITAKGIDAGFTVMSCVRARPNEIIEPGTFVYSPITLLGRLQSFGAELSVKTDNEKIYVTDLENVTTFIDALPNVKIDFPVEFEVKDTIVPKDIELTHRTVVTTEVPSKLGKDIVLYFGAHGFSVGLEDELTVFQKKLGSERFEELKIKLDGNYFDKIVSLIDEQFILSANENVVYIYANLDWGDAAYLISTLI